MPQLAGAASTSQLLRGAGPGEARPRRAVARRGQRTRGAGGQAALHLARPFHTVCQGAGPGAHCAATYRARVIPPGAIRYHQDGWHQGTASSRHPSEPAASCCCPAFLPSPTALRCHQGIPVQLPPHQQWRPQPHGPLPLAPAPAPRGPQQLYCAPTPCGGGQLLQPQHIYHGPGAGCELMSPFMAQPQGGSFVGSSATYSPYGPPLVMTSSGYAGPADMTSQGFAPPSAYTPPGGYTPPPPVGYAPPPPQQQPPAQQRQHAPVDYESDSGTSTGVAAGCAATCLCCGMGTLVHQVLTALFE